MATKVKGFFKALRYIAQVFDGKEEKEEEMQIGFPTDVKHVAHIGWDGDSSTQPNWMTEFKSSPEILGSKPENFKAISTSPQSEDLIHKRHSRRPSAASPRSPFSSTAQKSDAPKPSKRQPSTSTSLSLDSPCASPVDPKQSRRQRSSSNNTPTDSPIKESRRKKNSSKGGDLPEDQPSIRKHSRGRRSKGGSSGGSLKSSRLKGRNSSEEVAEGSVSSHGKNTASHLTSVLEAFD